MIQVTQTYLPEQEKYNNYLKEIWESGWLTNNGPMVLKLEDRLKQYLNIKNFNYCNNGTIALQIALKALNISKEVITTPFSYVATTNVILWENCKPVFVDINDTDFNIDTKQIEKHITANTEAILATHVFGNPCNIHEIEIIAKKYNLKVIYDAAHAFGVRYNNESLLSYGDISTCSFHATKIFHTGEGGAVICKNDEVNRKVYLMRQFGHIWDEYLSIGINGKASELHAAMGLCVLDDMRHIIERRKWVTVFYNERLNFSKLQVPSALPGTEYNYAYYPIVFSDEKTLLRVNRILHNEGIFPRRYFYPSLNNLPYLPGHSGSPVSESISSRILCLPLSTYLVEEELCKIISLTNNNI
jgi:dTDP-4-amino-4,6-dideoxygalactose transaminase